MMRQCLFVLSAFCYLHGAAAMTELEELSRCAGRVIFQSFQSEAQRVCLKTHSKFSGKKGFQITKSVAKGSVIFNEELKMPLDGTLKSLIDGVFKDQEVVMDFVDLRCLPSFKIPNISIVKINRCICLPYLDPRRAFPDLKNLIFFQVPFFHLSPKVDENVKIFRTTMLASHDVSEKSKLFNRWSLESSARIYDDRLDVLKTQPLSQTWQIDNGILVGAPYLTTPANECSELRRALLVDFFHDKGLFQTKSSPIEQKISLMYTTKEFSEKSFDVYETIEGKPFWATETGFSNSAPVDVPLPDFFEVSVAWRWSQNAAPFFEVGPVKVSDEELPTAISHRKNITLNMMTLLALQKWCDLTYQETTVDDAGTRITEEESVSDPSSDQDSAGPAY